MTRRGLWWIAAALPLLAICLTIIETVPAHLQSTVVFPGTTWTTRSPAEVGLSADKLNQFIQQVNSGGSSAGVIIKDGYLVASWGNTSDKFDWASAAKPVHSTLLMFALQEGRISSVDTPISNWNWAMQPADAALSFRHLANMTSGYTRHETPGEAWAYNDIGVMLYAQTLTRVFDTNLNQAALDRLAPLQFQDGSLFSSRSGYGVSTSVRDFARIGWFWLNRGKWNGQQLLPSSYFDAMMRPQVPGSLPRTQGEAPNYLNIPTIGGGTDQTGFGPGIYGFNWWFNAPVGTTGNMTWPDAPADTFQANGHWNVEVMTVIPSLRMVVAARGNWGAFTPGDVNASMNANLKLLASSASQPPAATDTPIPANTPTPMATPSAGILTAPMPLMPASGVVISNQRPTFSWSNVPNAKSFRLIVRKGSKVRIKRWLTREEGNCNGATCQISLAELDMKLPRGKLKWRVRARNSAITKVKPGSVWIKFSIIKP